MDKERTPESIKDEKDFLERVAKNHATLIDTEWNGRFHRYRIVCQKGHESTVQPSKIKKKNQPFCFGCSDLHYSIELSCGHRMRRLKPPSNPRVKFSCEPCGISVHCLSWTGWTDLRTGEIFSNNE